MKNVKFTSELESAILHEKKTHCKFEKQASFFMFFIDLLEHSTTQSLTRCPSAASEFLQWISPCGYLLFHSPCVFR